MQIAKLFASNLRKQRKAIGLTQEKLAEIAGLHRTYIGGIEQGRVNVSLKNIGKIADALDMEPMALFAGDESDGDEVARQKTARLADKPVGNTKNDRDVTVAIAIWTEDGIEFEPIETGYRDLTVQVLSDLVQQGYSGDELRERYRLVVSEIIEFLKR